MRTLKEKIKHAFAVEAQGEATPTGDQQAPVDWVCRQMAKRHLTTPGLIALELCRPLNYITAQMMHFSEPAIWAITPRNVFSNYRHLASFLEQRGSIEHLCRRLEEMESEYSEPETAIKKRDESSTKNDSDARAEDR